MKPLTRALLSTVAALAVIRGWVKISVNYLNRPYERAVEQVAGIESRKDVSKYLAVEEGIRRMADDVARNPANYDFTRIINAQTKLRGLETEELRAALEKREELRRQAEEEEKNAASVYGALSGWGSAVLGGAAFCGTSYALNRREKRRNQPYSPQI